MDFSDLFVPLIIKISFLRSMDLLNGDDFWS